MIITTAPAAAAPFIASTAYQSLYGNWNQGMLTYILRQVSTKDVGVSLECVKLCKTYHFIH